MLAGSRSNRDQVILYLFVGVPFVGLFAAIWLAWQLAVGWTDLALLVAFYFISCLGVTVGFHRYFTHGAFKAKRGLQVALAIAAMVATQGSLLNWVTDHRRHHSASDKEDDPHSPWLYGSGVWNLTKGLWHAHIGWLFGREFSNPEKYAPKLLNDRLLMRLSSLFPVWVGIGLLAPTLIGWLVGGTLWAAFTGFLWGGLVRICVLHHVTWSINSICHVRGKHPFKSGDHAGNVWWLAILSCGESWHNMHHAVPSSARHGVLRWQFDISARVIWLFEKLGWACDAQWPLAQTLRLRKERRGPHEVSRLRYMGCVEQWATYK